MGAGEVLAEGRSKMDVLLEGVDMEVCDVLLLDVSSYNPCLLV